LFEVWARTLFLILSQGVSKHEKISNTFIPTTMVWRHVYFNFLGCSRISYLCSTKPALCDVTVSQILDIQIIRDILGGSTIYHTLLLETLFIMVFGSKMSCLKTRLGIIRHSLTCSFHIRWLLKYSKIISENGKMTILVNIIFLSSTVTNLNCLTTFK